MDLVELTSTRLAASPNRLNRLRFRFIAGRRRGAVGVDVADLARFDARIANSIHHCQRGARAIFRR